MKDLFDLKRQANLGGLEAKAKPKTELEEQEEALEKHQYRI